MNATINPNSNHLIWLDLEMTGLNPDRDHILEIAMVVTDSDLNVVAESASIAIYQPPEVLALMDSWNVKQHTHSGLVERIKQSQMNIEQTEAELIEFLLPLVPPKKSPMCGNTICQDRRFLFRYMPKLEQYFHYRNLDVSTLKILAQRWAPKVYNQVKKESKHLALYDIYDSIAELKHYRENFLKY